MTTENMNQSVETTVETNEQPNINPGAIRKSTTQGVLQALSNAAGITFNSVEEAAAWSAKVASNVNVQRQVEEPVETNKKSSTNDLQQQFAKLQSDLQAKEQKLREKELDSNIFQSMGDRFDNDLSELAINKVKNQIRWEGEQYTIVNQRGEERYNSNGQPLTINELVDEVAKTNPKLLKQRATNGSGIKTGSAPFTNDDVIPDYATDPAAFNAWAARNGLGKGNGLKGMGVNFTATSSDIKIK